MRRARTVPLELPDSALPDPALPDPARPGAGWGEGRPFGVYIHVPFCATRCGYCDFNTYTPGELGTSASPESWAEAYRKEMHAAVELLARRGVDAPAAQTVFIGGGTPSLLGADRLVEVLGVVRDTFGLAPGAEVTTESNPESTSPRFFERLRAGGYTRISMGMQSAARHVLATLDRVHTPGRPVDAAREAFAAGFEHVNLDLIYGTPGERDEDLAASLDAVLDAGVDHVSAYSLIVEEGTAMARKVRRGELPEPDDDVLAARYEMVDRRLRGAGLDWYEVSNWARPGGECRHNIGYWDGGDWWGAGPGAHSHIGGVRWWNVKHPASYSAALAEQVLPVAGTEVLDAHDRHVERVLLTIRLASGLPLAELTGPERTAAERAAGDGLAVLTGDRLVLTDRGRLLADAVVRDILE
ncbi:radical SAM family heme chaperone HemW [Tomitella fengzijianii]|uniref:Heme chaperone HemW n=1 Tax=Tomitella fengzijianii TaxID=2597660 RepID=A0A516X8D3_9ACTN|nr:coproporphyrinogen III oxidase [Tomitella fengzijianii]